MFKKNKTWITIALIAVVVVILAIVIGRGSGTDNQQIPVSQQVTTKNQVSESDIAPEKLENSGDKVNPSEPDYYPGGPQPTGVYKNGQGGYNFNVSKYDLKDDIKGDWGVTKTGTYYCLKGLIDAGNIKKNPAQIKIAGYFSKDKKDRWRWMDVIVKKFDDKEYYTFDNSSGPVSDVNDNILFCFWYYKTVFFYPHEGVKTNALAVASDYAL